MRVRSMMAAVVAMSMSAQAFAAAPIDMAGVQAQITSDATKISKWTTDQFKVAIPFNSTSGNVTPKQLHLFGFDLGVEGGASGTKLDLNGLRNLGTTVINTNQIKNYDRLPIPLVLGHLKIGLPFGFDAGVRVGGIPQTNVNKDTTHLKVKNTIEGIDLRKALIDEGITRPFGLIMGLNFTHAHGSLDLTQPYSSNGTVVQNGTTYNSTLSATGAGHTDWDTKSIGLQFVLNKQILFFNPYVGVSANKNFGRVSSSLTTTGTETITNPSDSSDTQTQTVSAGGSSTATPNLIDLRALVGFELSPLPFFRLGLYGEYAGSRNIAGNLGLRVQFH